MMREEHARSCEAAFGEGFREVHDFLDQYAHRFPRIHRKLYHHKKGVELIVAKFGPEARKAAERHIVEDEGFVPEDHTYFEADDPDLLKLVEETYGGAQ